MDIVNGEAICKEGMGCKTPPGKPKLITVEQVKVDPLVLLPTHYCGKMMYDEDNAKRVVRTVNGLRGYYWCENCQAFHVTRQSQEPARQQWFKDNPKLFRNKYR